MAAKIVHFLDSDKFGGCEEAVLSLLATLDHHKWNLTVFHYPELSGTPFIESLGKIGISHVEVPRGQSLFRFGKVAHLARLLRITKPTIFHAHLNWPLGCRHALIAARLARVPLSVATAQLFTPISDSIGARVKQRLQACMIHRYIAVSEEVKRGLRDDLGVPETKVEVIPNCFRARESSSAAASKIRAQFETEGFKHLVLTPARLHSQKGIEYLLEAAQTIPESLFLLAGDGPDRVKLEKQARDLHLQNVRFLGFRTDVPDLLAASDLFALPSLYEGMPLSVLEAMAAGKPVVATNIGGTNESVIHNQTGLLVPPKNSAALASAIRKLISDPESSRRLALAGRARALSMYSQSSMAAATSALYDTLLAKQQRSTKPRE